jgi:hypothetical protein
MGLSSKKTKTKPIIMPEMKGAEQQFATNTTNYLQTDPHQFVAPVTPLQSQAFQQAQSLTDMWKPDYSQAIGLAQHAADYPAATAQSFDYMAPRLGNAAHVNAARLGAAPIVNAADPGAPALAEGTSVDPTANAEAFMAKYGGILEGGGIQKYLDPGSDAFVNATLAAYDQDSARQGAAMRANAARNGAFGGSRYGLAEGQFAADTAMKRAQTEGELRRQNYLQAVQTALGEAGSRLQADTFNAGLQTQVSGQNAAAANERARFMAELAQSRHLADQGARNQFDLARAGFQQEANLANQNLLGQYGLRQSEFDQQAATADADAASRFQLAQFGADADAAQFGAAARNAVSLSNQDYQERQYLRALQAAGIIGDLSSGLGAGLRADLGLTADLGNVQRGIESEYLNAPVTQLQIARGIFPPEAYLGSKNKTSGLGYVWDGIANLANAAGNFIPAVR